MCVNLRRRAAVGIRHSDNVGSNLSFFTSWPAFLSGKQLSHPRGQHPHPPSNPWRNRIFSDSYQKSPRIEAHRTRLSPMPIPEIITVGRRQRELIDRSARVTWTLGVSTHCMCSRGQGEAILQRRMKVRPRRKRNGHHAGRIRCPLVYLTRLIESNLTCAGHTCDIYSFHVTDIAPPLHTPIPY